MSEPEVTLLLPGYESLVSNTLNQNEIPNSLKKFLLKSDFVSDSSSLVKRIFHLFYPSLSTADDLPIAALRSQDEDVVCVDPCHVYADQGRLLLFREGIHLTDDEADTIITYLQPLFKQRGFILRQHSSNQWLLENVQNKANFTALTELEGRSVMDALPEGHFASDWLTLWNEVQMSLFDLPLNKQREQQGQLTINSVWFWGAEQLPTRVSAWSRVIGSEEVLHDLAQWHSIPIESSISSFQIKLSRSEKVLICLPSLDWQSNWQRQLEEAEKNIFSPLWKSLRYGKIKRVQLCIPHWGNYALTPVMSWKFW